MASHYESGCEQVRRLLKTGTPPGHPGIPLIQLVAQHLPALRLMRRRGELRLRWAQHPDTGAWMHFVDLNPAYDRTSAIKGPPPGSPAPVAAERKGGGEEM